MDRTQPLTAAGLSVVLVEPEQAANIGFVARTMACYGLTNLRIVGSQAQVQDPAAKKTAKGAGQILDSALVYKSLASAIEDCHFSFGFTRRAREPAQKILNIRDAALAWNAAEPSEANTALVFGRESQGLSREETFLLSHLVRIHLPNETLSLNVSHAAAIAFYAFLEEGLEGLSNSKPIDREHKSAAKELPIHADQMMVLKNLTELLEAKGFFKKGKEEAQQDYVRILWQRLQPNKMELEFLAGMLNRLVSNSK